MGLILSEPIENVVKIPKLLTKKSVEDEETHPKAKNKKCKRKTEPAKGSRRKDKKKKKSQAEGKNMGRKRCFGWETQAMRIHSQCRPRLQELAGLAAMAAAWALHWATAASEAGCRQPKRQTTVRPHSRPTHPPAMTLATAGGVFIRGRW
jgi:hypothetical protein